MKYIEFGKIREEKAQEVGDDCQTQEDLRAEKSKKRGWDKAIPSCFPSCAGKRGQSLRFRGHKREKEREMNILIYSLNVLSAYSVSGIENLVSSLKYLLRHTHCN